MSTSSLNEEFYIQPTVVLSILDIYLRKPADKQNVIGVLLGTKSDNVTTIEEAFYVSHEMDVPESVRLDLNAIDRLAAAFRLTNNRVQVVGWFTTYTTILISHQLIQTTLATRFNCPSLLMLVVNPCSSHHKQLQIAGYTHRMLLTEAHTRFTIVPVKHVFYEQDCIALDAMINGLPVNADLDAPSFLPSEDTLFRETVDELASNLKIIDDYVKNVTKSGQTDHHSHRAICRQLVKALSQISVVDPNTSYDKVLQDKMNDLALFANLSVAALREVKNAYQPLP